MAISKWAIDKGHSFIDFSIRHLKMTKVRGSFEQFDAVIEADPEDLTTAKIEFTIDTASINTRFPDRDRHLKSADFFDVENHPAITFKAEKITKTDDNEYDLTGPLTIKGVTREVTFSVEYEGMDKDPFGNVKIGFSGESKINRSDFGLTWNAPLESGGFLLDDEVKISLEIQAVKQS